MLPAARNLSCCPFPVHTPSSTIALQLLRLWNTATYKEGEKCLGFSYQSGFVAVFTSVHHSLYQAHPLVLAFRELLSFEVSQQHDD